MGPCTIRYTWLQRALKAVFVAVEMLVVQCATTALCAAPQDVVDIGPITVSSETVQPGRHPDIETRIGILQRAKAGSLAVNVVAVVTQPDRRVRSWNWKRKLSRESATLISVPKEYDCSAPGTYRVDVVVYSDDMKQRYGIRSRTFTVAGEPPAARPRGEAAGAEAVSARRGEEEGKRVHAGAGLYGNVLNPAGGGTVLLWPSKYVGVQGLYSAGTFESYEGRLLGRYALTARYSVYAGVGYLHVAADKDILGVPTRFEDRGVSGTVGVEVALGSRVLLYVESSAAKIDLVRTVTGGGQTVIATVDYAPVTIGCALVWALF